MATTCQFSYPLNSANASPPGTFTVYLSWADRALPPNALTSAVTIAIVPMPLLFITRSSFVKRGRFDFSSPLSSRARRSLLRHLGNLREHVAFSVRLLRARAAARFRLQLLDTLLHRGSFLVRESLDRPAGHGGALGGLPCTRLWAHGGS